MTTSTTPAVKVRRLQHVVLQVSDVERSVRFYEQALGLELHRTRPNGNAFMRIPGGGNDHDLALFPKPGIGAASADTAGLIHAAWEVDDINELARAKERLAAMGALVDTTNHGMSFSVYGQDPDGLQFEIFWAPPGAPVGQNVPLDLEAELKRYG
ncbi:MAG: VOC family protein [Dehalococcoidia bacterium]